MAEVRNSFSQMVPLPMNDAEPAPSIPKGTLMAGKRGLIMGVANDRSIAWGIAQAIAAQGGEVAFTYQGEALEKRVRPLAESVGSSLVVPCDVAEDASMDAAFGAVEQAWGGLDFLVHAIGFADKQYLRGRYLDTPRDAFLQAMDISCYSFVAVGRRAAALMKPGRVATDPFLSGRRTRDTSLQCDGCGQSRVGKPACATWRPIWGKPAFA
jgi:enoyl-[acyl-carrier protein] reductase I